MNKLNVKGMIVGSYSHDFVLEHYDIWYNSTEFTIEGIADCNFQIQVCESEHPHSLQISVNKSNEKRGFAKITISFRQKKIMRIVDDWTNICFMMSELSHSTVINIKIKCEIIWYLTTEDPSPIEAPVNLFSGLKDFQLNASLSDLKISINGEELPAHKIILAANSPVFLRMFETDMKEKTDNRIVIEGIELNVMKIVLSILYTGHDKDLDEVEMAMKVLIVTERYDMETLKRLCEWKLFQKLEISNVLGILDVAANCNAEVLRAECINFIVRNKEQMVEAKDLTTICHRTPEVMCELLKKLMSTPSYQIIDNS